jgi:hypothetical protein
MSDVTVQRTPETARGWMPRMHGGGRDANDIYERALEVLRSASWHDHSGSIGELNRQYKESVEAAAAFPDVTALSDSTYRGARTFLCDLPHAYPAPDIAVLENGEVSFDWQRDDGGSIAVMLLDRTTIIYASLWEGADAVTYEASGTLEFAQTVPDEIVSELRALF